MARPTVAVVGASANREKYSNRSLLAHARCGYEVYPISPRGGEIEGHTAYTSIVDTPVSRFDRVTMYVPPSVGEKLVPEIAAKGCDELWLNPGSESPELIDAAERLGLHVVVACSLIDCERRTDPS